MRLSYEDHQAVAFISVTKNQSVAAAIATMALNSVSALAPAIIPMIQPVIAIIYIHLEKPARKLLAPRSQQHGATAESVTKNPVSGVTPYSLSADLDNRRPEDREIK